MFFTRKKERELFERELELPKEKSLAEIATAVALVYKEAEKQKHDYECTWHREREKLATELAKMEGKITALKETEEAKNKMITEREKELEYLRDIVKIYIEKSTVYNLYNYFTGEHKQ